MKVYPNNLTAMAFGKFFYGRPAAQAEITGSDKYPDIHGNMYLYYFQKGSLVLCDVVGLPTADKACSGHFFGFHIHEGGSCSGNAQDPFADAGGHLNPQGCEHPYHMGDFPMLFGDKGSAWCAFYTDRFLPEDVIGRTVIIHDMADDYRSQPAGDSGERIACGVIVPWKDV